MRLPGIGIRDEGGPNLNSHPRSHTFRDTDAGIL